ncbi:MAG: ABC transporter permease [Nitrospirae bacterium]|nr:ABC transporter permease [Nitrospirota bacterium]
MKLRAILKKELKHYFFSPLAYIVTVIFLLITGWFFANSLFLLKEAEMRGMLDILPILLMFVIPAITMRSIAEERKMDTVQILLTLPIREGQIILGKYMALLVFYSTVLIFTLFYPLVLMLLGRPDTGVILSSYLGMFLLGATYISIGIFASSLTSSQVIAFITGFAIIFLIFIPGKLENIMPVKMQPLIEGASVVSHFENLLRGVVSSTDIVYFVMLNILFLTLSIYALREKGK